MENIMHKILGSLRRTVEQFDMIQKNDRIAVCISGGKDSMALLEAMHRYQYFSSVPFELEAITLDLGFGNMDFTPIAKYCEEISVPYSVKKTEIGPIVFDARKEKNPCALCSRMKRGAIHDFAIEQHCKKIAFGHHADDAIETFLMSLFFEGRINTFKPVTYLSRKDITLIRPLIMVKEKDIIHNKILQELPIVKNTCPADGHTKREEMKTLISQLKRQYPKIDDRMLTAFQNADQFQLWF